MIKKNVLFKILLTNAFIIHNSRPTNQMQRVVTRPVTFKRTLKKKKQPGNKKNIGLHITPQPHVDPNVNDFLSFLSKK